MLRINPLVQSDSYKISQPPMYPENMNMMFDYGCARKGGKFEESVPFGMQMFIKEILYTPFTQHDLDGAVDFYALHFGSDEVFDKDMFQYILDEYEGYFPIKIKSVPEGLVIPNGNVLYTFECSDPKCATIVSFLETKSLSYVWYGTTVATNSYHMKKIIKEYGEETSDTLPLWIDFALHDFGARGVSPGSQGVGGAAHLINFMGSDNTEGIYNASRIYWVKEGLPGYSIPATEHSVMCSEGRDGEMIVAQRVFDHYATKKGIHAIAMVNDTYDMEKHIIDFSKIFKERYMDTGVRWVTRPDSGHPPEMVIKCLDLLWDEFGGTINSKGFKVLHPQVRIIQGDGIDIEMLETILKNVGIFGYSIENVAFGSGGGLLQKVNRDTLRFAMKASYLEVDGFGRNVYKEPKTQNGDYDKSSLKGKLSLYQLGNGEYMTLTDDKAEILFSIKGYPIKEVLETVYDSTVVGHLKTKFYTFDEVRENARK